MDWGLAVPCCPGRRLPPGLRSTPRRRLTLTHPPGSPRPAALNSLLLPWRTVQQVNLCCGKKKKKNQKTDGTALVGDLKLILSLKYSVYRASRYGAQQRSSAPGWPGWGVMRSEDHQTLFRTVWTTSPQLSHGARLSPSQACWWK